MSRHALCLVVTIASLFALGNSQLYKFQRSVLETGSIFFKLKLTLGKCADSKLFMESKMWANVRMNRVFDIYYKNANPTVLVSKVEITLIINNTDVSARSERGVGFTDFSGFVILPTRSGFVLYTINYYMCNSLKLFAKKESLKDKVQSPPFIDKLGESASDEAYDKENDYNYI